MTFWLKNAQDEAAADPSRAISTLLGGTGAASDGSSTQVGTLRVRLQHPRARACAGSIAVTAEEDVPPPPPPVDPGPAALPNPTTAPTVFEEG